MFFFSNLLIIEILLTICLDWFSSVRSDIRIEFRLFILIAIILGFIFLILRGFSLINDFPIDALIFFQLGKIRLGRSDNRLLDWSSLRSISHHTCPLLERLMHCTFISGNCLFCCNSFLSCSSYFFCCWCFFIRLFKRLTGMLWQIFIRILELFIQNILGRLFVTGRFLVELRTLQRWTLLSLLGK